MGCRISASAALSGQYVKLVFANSIVNYLK